MTARREVSDGRAPGWIDLDGWEQGHRLLAASDLSGIDLTAVQRVSIDLLAGTRTTEHRLRPEHRA